MPIFTHVTVGTNDLAKARAFYDAVLAPATAQANVPGQPGAKGQQAPKGQQGQPGAHGHQGQQGKHHDKQGLAKELEQAIDALTRAEAAGHGHHHHHGTPMPADCHGLN